MVVGMEIAAVLERVERLAGAGADGAVSKLDLESGLVAAREIEAWVESRRAAIVTQLAAVDSFPEATIAKAAKTSVGKASKSTERAGTLVDSPRLAEALGDGAVTSGHVDAVTRAGKQLDQAQRAELLNRVESLVDVAAAATVEEFDRRVRLEADRVRSSDGMDRLERQRRDTRVRTWVGPDGMWNLNGRFDPVTGVQLAAKLDQAAETLFAETTPEHAPDDPIEKQRFLAAQALARLVQGSAPGGRSGRVEILAVVDAGSPRGAQEPVTRWRRRCRGGSPWRFPLGSSPSSQPATMSTSSAWSSATASCCTLPVCSTRAAAHDWRTGPSGEHCGPCTRPVVSRDARSASTAARSITSSGGATVDEPTLPTCCRSAPGTMRRSTTTAGRSHSDRTGSSPSTSRTAR